MDSTDDPHAASPAEISDDLATLPLSLEERQKIAARAAEQEGDLIGPYKLLQQIGEGGFGSVWMAEQSKPISRKVALKIIKLGMDTKEVIARFEQERQALAMMDHSNIAKVFDAGATDQGRPFFVMELVKGIPITQYCDEARLGTRERLGLFGDVCAAIQHAHQKGVIHRDIKPSNVMVTLHGDKPVVKVIDFGIAKATHGRLTDKTLFTRFDQFIGTPVYMSPEQASFSGLDIDTRSDIYALGILLYELLTGKPPFDAKTLASAGYEEMRRIIREVEPPKPSSRLSTMAGDERTTLAKARHIEPEKLHRLVESDLDWIVMKAIEKDRARRYETASAFAQDIAHFLADEAVSATPPSAGYQFRKFARRNKAALRVATAIAAVLVAATAVSTWQAVRATRAEQETAEALVKVAAERDAKDLARKDAEDIAKFLTDVFQSPDPARDGREIRVVELLDKAAKKLETDLAAQPAQRAKLQATLGNTYLALGLAGQAIPLQEKVRDYHLATSSPEHPDTLNAMHNLAAHYSTAGRLEDALKTQEEVLALRRKVFGPENLDTLMAMSNLANTYCDVGRLKDGLKMQEEVLALRLKVLGPEHAATLKAMNNLAVSYSAAGREDEALKMKEEVLVLSDKKLGQEHPETLVAMGNLANSYSAAGRRDEALKLREKVLALSHKKLGPEHPDTFGAMGNLSNSYYEAGRRGEALKLLEEALALSHKMLGPEHPYTLDAVNDLALCYSAVGRRDEALKLQEEVLPLHRRILGPEHPETLRAMNNLAYLYYKSADRRGEALKLQEEVMPLHRRILGPEHPETLRAMNNLALFYKSADRRDEALKLLEEVLPLSRKVIGPEHPNTLFAMGSLAVSYYKVGRQEDALKLQAEELQIRRKVNGPEHSDTLKAMHNLALSYAATGRQDEALKLREEVLPLRRKVNGPGHPDTLTAMGSLAISYRAKGEVVKAEALENEIAATKAKAQAAPPASK
jgi:serine/threonine protein kinase